MRVRRCAIVVVEPRERLALDLALVAGGGSGLRHLLEQVAIAPHLAREVVLPHDAAAVLLRLSPSRWCELAELEREHARSDLEVLLECGLLVREGSDADTRDHALRDAHWHATAATMHYASRWSGVDTEALQREFTELAAGSLLDLLGAAPPPVHERVPAQQRQPLPAADRAPLDALLDRRVTCRNFDRAHVLELQAFSSVLYRAYGARTVDDYAPGVQLLKKGVPSAGGLHATEAYLLVQRVEGVEPGLYHYHPVAHALEPIRSLAATDAAALARRFVAAQAWFVDVPVMVIPTSRFRRNFWKYRNHAKAYRALILDVGHLSQAMYLAATELGLAAFITAAINEVDIEHAFDLDPLEHGPLAVCGFGLRGAERREVEFDPLGVAWPAA